MLKHFSSFFAKIAAFLGALPGRVWRSLVRLWRKNIWGKLVLIVASLAVILLSTAYGIARWYIASEQSKPFTLGATFIPAYAQSLGLDPQKTMDALLDDAKVKNLRLVSYWNQLEPQKGQYDFSLLDWQFQKAEAAHAKVSLAIGLRQPRWPECHVPAWAQNEPVSQWQPQLNDFIRAVVHRYKDSPSLGSYQLENEYFLESFGTCTDFSRARLVNEFNLVKQADPRHPIIMSRSNNFPSWITGQPQPDVVGMSVYRRVWDGTVTHKYFTYPLPAWYYAFLAGTQKILTGKDSIVHEMQAEPWPPNGKSITEISLDEQNKTFDGNSLEDRVSFSKATGMREVYLWGAEYWYYRMVTEHDPSAWSTAKKVFEQN